MKRTVPYYFYKKVDGMDVHRELLGDNYNVTIKENNRYVSILFCFDENDNVIIRNIYKNKTNYQNYRYLKQYIENDTLIATLMKCR